MVVSHDRYFLERVTDSTWALLGDGQISMLPRGVEEYLERRAAALSASPSTRRVRPGRPPVPGGPAASAGELREARKAVARLDKQLSRLAEREASCTPRWSSTPATTSGSPRSTYSCAR